MTHFDNRDAHSLVCMQANREIPDCAQECVCPRRLPRTFQPDFGIEGPSEGDRPYTTIHRIACWVLGILFLASAIGAIGFIGGALLRHFNKV